jgi:Protein of unknown function (DUF2637)
MSAQQQTPLRGGPVHLQMAWWDRLAIMGLGATGFASSYDALRQMALAIHTSEALSWLFPIFIDGFIAYGIRALMLMRNSHIGARIYVWLLFLAATSASLWANVLRAVTLNKEAHSGPAGLHLGDWAVGVLSMLAPLALAGSVHLFIIMARTAEAVPDDSGTRPGRVAAPLDGPVPTASPASGAVAADAQDPAVSEAPPSPAPAPQALADPAGVMSTADGPVAHPEEPQAVSGAEGPDPLEEVGPPSVPDDDQGPSGRAAADDWLVGLLPIARDAARRAGRISRDAISQDVRAHVALGNDRLSELVNMLKEEEAGEAAAAANAAAT